MIIGLSGKKRSGKDETCKILSEVVPTIVPRLRVQRVAFGDAVKEEAYTYVLGPLGLASSVEASVREENRARFRKIWQFWGTEVRREMCEQPTYWVDALKAKVQKFAEDPANVVVVTDVRFVNEVEAVKSLGGIVVRLERDVPVDETSSHASETALDNYQGWDWTLDNRGSVDELRQRVEIMVQWMAHGEQEGVLSA